MKKYSAIILASLAAMLLGVALQSCNDSKSYAELLTDENKEVNYFLSQHRVIDEIPADSVFETGPDAPYYKMDNEGNVYMQVLDKGSSERPILNARVYFRYMRYNLYNYVVGGDNNVGSGNADNVGYTPTFFLLGNMSVQQSTQYGTGIQVPMYFLGYDAKVNLVVKSQQGATSEVANVIPYLYTISYFKSQI